MLANLPESEPIMPRCMRILRAYQLVCEPLSPHKILFDGKRGDSSEKTRWGLMGTALSSDLSSTSSHQSDTFSSSVFIPERSAMLFSSVWLRRSVYTLYRH